MEKFLSIPVTDKTNQLVSCNDIKLIFQSLPTTVTIVYGNGKGIVMTHATAGTGVETERDAIQAAVISALQMPWTKPAYAVTNLPFAISAISISNF